MDTHFKKILSISLDIRDWMIKEHHTPLQSVQFITQWLHELAEQEDADFVLLPEYCWAILARFFKDEGNSFKDTSAFFWQKAWPHLQTNLAHPKRVWILGSAPFYDESTQALYNRCPILMGESHGHQDKIHLTPWENQFHKGHSLRAFEHGGVRFQVLICFDAEVPELVGQMRPHRPHLLFIPSTTEDQWGERRVSTCAAARSVELGCYGFSAHLRGFLQDDEEVELISDNFGGAKAFYPAQETFDGLHLDQIPEQNHKTQWCLNTVDLQLVEKSWGSEATNPASIRA